ncbi:MAG: S49 family peptidase [Pikeienuella sp.]
MPHELTRVLRAVAGGIWFIEPKKADQIVHMLALRHGAGPRSEPAFPERMANVSSRPVGGETPSGSVHVIQCMGAIVPRTSGLEDISGPGVTSLEQFQSVFSKAAGDQSARAIVLNMDSPGGQVDLVPETVQMIREAQRPDRPIVAVANTMACSAAYWLACGADEIVVSPSACVGSIGVYSLHQDVSARLVEEGIAPTFIYEGPRKVEGNPFEPLDAVALRAMQEDVRHYYEMFTTDVAAARGVDVSVVRADPEEDGPSFGGGRSYNAERAVALGLADRVETLQQVLSRLTAPRAPKGKAARRAAARRLRIA